MDLSELEFDAEILEKLSVFLEHSPVATLVATRIHHLTPVLLEQILDIAEHNENLKRLDLDSNALGDEGAEFVARILPNTHLSALSLRRNAITHVGLRSLLEGIAESATLTDLILSQNMIGDRGAVELARFLQAEERLNLLHISYNSITLSGARALAAAFKTGCKLKSFSCMNNSFGMAGFKKLFNAFKTNTALRHLIFGHNDRFVLLPGRRLEMLDPVKMDEYLGTYLSSNPFLETIVMFGLSEFAHTSAAFRQNSMLAECTFVSVGTDNSLARDVPVMAENIAACNRSD